MGASYNAGNDMFVIIDLEKQLKVPLNMELNAIKKGIEIVNIDLRNTTTQIKRMLRLR